MVGRMGEGQGVRAVRQRSELHAGVVNQPRLGQGRIKVAGQPDDQGALAARLHLAHRHLRVRALGRVGRPGGAVAGQAEFRPFADNARVGQARLLGQHIAEGGPCVVGPQHKLQREARRRLLPQLDDGLLVMVADRAPLAVDRPPGIIGLAALDAGDGKTIRQAPRAEFQPKARGGNHGLAAIFHAVMRTAGDPLEILHFQKQASLSIWRNDFHRPAGGSQKADRTKQDDAGLESQHADGVCRELVDELVGGVVDGDPFVGHFFRFRQRVDIARCAGKHVSRGDGIDGAKPLAGSARSAAAPSGLTTLTITSPVASSRLAVA